MEPVYLKVGDQLKLTCEQNGNFRTAWLRHTSKRKLDEENEIYTDDNKYEKVHEGFILKSYSKDGRFINTLIKENVTEDDAGSYKCEVLNNLQRSYAVDVNIFRSNLTFFDTFYHPFEISLIVTALNGISQGTGNQTVLGCVLHSDTRSYPEVEWRRNEKIINIDDSHNKYIINTSLRIDSSDFYTTLTIKRTNDQDSGLYTCSMRFGPIWFNQTVQLFAPPNVRILDRSISSSEGSQVEVVCVVFGWPTPVISWLRSDNSSISKNRHQRIYYSTPYEILDNDYDNDADGEEDDDDADRDMSSDYDEDKDNDDRDDDPQMTSNKKSKFSSGKFQMINSTLIITDVQMSDRDIYICEAIAYVNDSVALKSRSMVLLRVKGKYAFIYPLIGIIIEFVVLLTIIVFYERKRKKEAATEEVVAPVAQDDIFNH
ncbi:hypothetical protein HELRODRAFT_194116 [Helobdella robusta]|uniref:Ig-like domain-containing protein n=1 Tax=Helobdella robusta TaxID=6412 RepID=T1FVP8_HELRO|nr:hypothetical protein HELRODRAFT_194116 [Helobdella robusta]ESN93290.1 hypothetical protein HELRODRAFT_194116 [Helobdella robusta]